MNKTKSLFETNITREHIHYYVKSKFLTYFEIYTNIYFNDLMQNIKTNFDLAIEMHSIEKFVN